MEAGRKNIETQLGSGRENLTVTNSNLYDLIIIGSGGAGLTAGIYAGRAKLKTLIIGKDKPGGQIAITNEVANYPGIFQTTGAELGETMKKQAQNFGSEHIEAEVLSVDFSADTKEVVTSAGTFESVGVIIATGARPRTLGFVGEDTYRGRGIGYCATCDGEFFSGMDVFVVGAGFAAAEEAIFLTRYARKVIVIAREPEFTCSASIADKVLAHPKIEVRFNTELLEVGGEKVLRYAVFKNNQTGEITRYEVTPLDVSFGVFVFVGYMPQSEAFRGQVELDPAGYIPTDVDMKTNVPGIYAAGDIRFKKLRQLVTSVSDGGIAATEAEKYIKETKERLGLSIEAEPHGQTENPTTEAFLDDDFRSQLVPVLERFEKPVSLVAVLDPAGEVGREMKAFLEEFSSLSDKIRVQYVNQNDSSDLVRRINPAILPTVAIVDADGNYTGVQYHGVPGGHEINSFVIALYNTAGPGQKVEQATLNKISSVEKPVNFKIGVSLSCTMCPDVVAATQLMAVKNPNVEAEMIDVAKFPEFKAKYSIMSVPAIIVNDNDVHFGKKTLDELAEFAQA